MRAKKVVDNYRGGATSKSVNVIFTFADLFSFLTYQFGNIHFTKRYFSGIIPMFKLKGYGGNKFENISFTC